MYRPVPSELREICAQISGENRSVKQWAQVESDDMFQNGTITGGFDASEGAFTFSLYEGGDEYWFQLSLSDVGQVLDGSKTTLDVRLAES